MSPDFFLLSEILSGIGLSLQVNLEKIGVYIESSQLGTRYISTFIQYLFKFCLSCLFMHCCKDFPFSSSRSCTYSYLFHYWHSASSLKMN